MTTDQTTRTILRSIRNTQYTIRNAQSASQGPWSVVRGLSSAFTLVELLIVIAIIAILAAFIFPVTGIVRKNRIKTRARSELIQVETALESYKTHKGFYPPSDTNINSSLPATVLNIPISLNSLYFELSGATNNSTACVTLDGSAQVPNSAISTTFGPSVGGILNVSQGSGDEVQKPTRFLPTLQAGQFLIMNNNSTPFAVLGTALQGPAMITDPTTLKTINPWRYRNPGISNINGIDIWTVVNIGNQWNMICNWSKTPLIVTSPQ